MYIALVNGGLLGWDHNGIKRESSGKQHRSETGKQELLFWDWFQIMIHSSLRFSSSKSVLLLCVCVCVVCVCVWYAVCVCVRAGVWRR